MATSAVDVCNLALGRIAHSAFIESLDGNSAAARACKQFYAQKRDAVLERFWWPFATRQTVLAELASVTHEAWGYVYALPSDCLTDRYIWSGVRNPTAEQRIPYAIGANAALNGKVLLTDKESAELVYTARITTVPMFSALFVEALAWVLAAELAMALPGKREYRADALRMFEMELSTAMSGVGGQDDVRPDSELLTARY